MTEPATPPQLAANNMVATETVDPSSDERLPPSTRDLIRLQEELHQAIGRIDVEGTDPEATEILVRWHDILDVLAADVAQMLTARQHDAGPDRSLTDIVRGGIRDLTEGTALKAVVADGTRLLDLLTDAIAAVADPDDRAELEVRRREVVHVVNGAQDRLDA
ncbi:hypothetical protein MWU52_00825 [Jannaschia sp. S6380]|uniref:hypothetical protein n=1 Tax=Jannaschia sp. S6380 TaxID=2926408 RepID=UPI001FF0F032|nr:hypothetical protein [Jannaschia sp. S6380]MCK0166086.1 hypothetical protein [Jannaschia sp. S6380]